MTGIAMVSSQPGADAQSTLRTEVPRGAMERLEEMGEIDGAAFHRILSENLRLSHEGEEPLGGRLIIFFVTSDGDLRGSVTGEAITLRPGQEMRGADIPAREFIALFDETTRGTYGTGAFMVPLGPVALSDIAYEFEDAWQEGRSWTPEYEQAWLRALSEGVEWGRSEDSEGAVGLAFVPVLGRYSVGNPSLINVQYVAAMNQNADWGGDSD